MDDFCLVSAVPLLLIATMGWFGGGDCFKAAVYEKLDPRHDSRPLNEIMLDSVETYRLRAKQAASQGAHIIVFPEYGTTGLGLPFFRQSLKPFLQVFPHLQVNASDNRIPCLEPDTGFNVTILHGLSCAAREAGIVLVANIMTMLQCDWNDDHCPTDGEYHFSTDVAFDVDGKLLASYHKINLYLEHFDYPPHDYAPTGVTFTTSEATFGLITCFDILWKRPTQGLINKEGVRYIVQPTAWLDGLPQATSVQSQMEFAMGHNVTLLSANLHMFPANRGGSGIYDGARGVLNHTYGSLCEDLLIVADTDQEASTQPAINTTMNFRRIIYSDLSKYTMQKLETTGSNVTATSGTFKCNLQYKFESRNEANGGNYGYYLAAYQGHMAIAFIYRFAIEHCAVLWCANQDKPVKSCAHPPVDDSQARFEQLTLEGHFTTQTVYPSVLDKDMRLVDTSKWSFTKDETTTDLNTTDVTARISTKEQFLYRPLVVALFGRNFDKD